MLIIHTKFRNMGEFATVATVCDIHNVQMWLKLTILLWYKVV